MSPRYQLYEPTGEDWYTFQNGAGSITDLDPSGDQTITYESAYPKQTDLDAITMEAVPRTGVFPHNYTPMSEPEGSGSFPPYLAIYVQAGTGTSANDTSGWHVFQDANVAFGTRTRWRTPVAWPSGSNNNDGRLGTSQTTNQACAVVTLSQAPAASGSGGTDSWTAPGWL